MILEKIYVLFKHYNENMQNVERDLAGLCEQIKRLDDKGNKLCQIHSEAAEQIYDLQRQINEQWNLLTYKANNRKEKLLWNYDYERFLSEYNDLIEWINGMKELISSEELGNDGNGAEALLERHQEYGIEINARLGRFEWFDEFGRELINCNDYCKNDIIKYLENIDNLRKNLEEIWIEGR